MQVKLFLRKKKDLGFALIKIGGIILISLSSFISFARVPDFQTRLYSPFNDKNVSFQLSSPQLDELFYQKYKIKLGKLKINKIDQKFTVDLKSLKLSEKIKLALKKNIIDKAHIITGSSLKRWLENYNFIEEQNGWYSYEDKEGLLDNKVIKLKFNNSKIKLIEKTSIGTNRTTYKYMKLSMHKKLVLSSVVKEIFDGLQKIFVTTSLNYKKDENGLYVDSFEQVTQHFAGEALGQKIQREIKETYFVNNLKF